MQSFKSYLNEGVNDPAIFKAVFLAGGPGSGKSFIVGRTALQPMGFKLINSDPAFEAALKKAGLSMDPKDIGSVAGQEVRAKAKAITKKQMDLALAGRLGLIIDGTGKDYEKIARQVNNLREIGYAVIMIFVNTDLDTALARNAARSRSLPDAMVTKMWNDVQKNIGKFQNLFRDRMIVIDNSDGANYEGAVLNAYRKISAWSKTEPKDRNAKKWIDQQKKSK
jgi:predicted ABC-type ATPase